jgi:Fe-S-cluster containining protein
MKSSEEEGMATPAAPRAKKRREDLKPGEVLCAYCTAKCCRYFALPLDRPTRWKDFDFIRWFLMHAETSVFIEDGAWYLIVHTQCQHLSADNRCQIYDTRPRICREYSTENCEYEDEWVYEAYFETAEQVYEYAEALLGPPPGASFRSPAPSLLPILANA